MLYKTTIGLVLILFAILPQTVISQELEIDQLSPQAYAQHRVVEVWGEQQFYYFEAVVMKESKWIPTAQNPVSSAYGIPQFLDSTWDTVGCVKTDDAHIQVDCMIKYIDERYGTPQKALNFHKENNYY